MQNHDVELSGSLNSDFLYHWTRCESFMCKEASEKSVDGTFHHAFALINLLVQYSSFSDRVFSPSGRELLHQLADKRPLDRLLLWIESKSSPSASLQNEPLGSSNFSTGKLSAQSHFRDLQRRLLGELFELLLSRSRQEVLSDLTVVRPLLQYLFKLNSQLRPAYASIYGQVLHNFCILLCRYKTLYSTCRHVSNELFGEPYLVFSLLVPLLHQYDVVGDCARDALLLVLLLSKNDDMLGAYLAFQSDLCPILATGLSALYSSLPKRLVSRQHFRMSESPGGPVQFTTTAILRPTSSSPCLIELPVGGASWHQLTDWEWNQSPDLRRLLHTLDFCNLVVKISHVHVRNQLLQFIHSGFLVPIIGSALHQNSMDGVVAATAYLELFLRRLTEPEIIKLFLNYILTGTHDNYSVLTSLINRLNANAVLGMVTLSLFRTILNFHCEDVMYELIFKHLLPLHHVDLVNWSSSHYDRSHPKVSPCIAHSLQTKESSPDRLLLGLLGSADRFINLANTATYDQIHRKLPENVLTGAACRLRPEMPIPSRPFSANQLPTETAAVTQISQPPQLLSDEKQEKCSGIKPPACFLINPHEEPSLVAYIKSAHERIDRRRQACLSWTSTYDFTLSIQTGISSDRPLPDVELARQETKAQESVLFGRLYSTFDHAEEDGVSSPIVTAKSSLHGNINSLYQLNYLDDLSDEDESRESDVKVDNTLVAEDSVVVCTPDSGTDKYDQPMQLTSTVDNAPVCCTCCTQLPQGLDISGSLTEGDDMKVFLALMDRLDSPWQCQVHFDSVPSNPSWPAVVPDVLDLLDYWFDLLSVNPASDVPITVNSTTQPTTSPDSRSTPQNMSVRMTDSVSSSSSRRSLTNSVPVAGGMGPFLSILLGRLTSMHTNCLFTNLLLTDLLAALACYPCPLLYHVLLNSVTLPIKSNITSLYKLAHSVRNQLHATACSVDNWEILLCRARLYLHSRDGSMIPRSVTSTHIIPDFYSTHNTDRNFSVSSDNLPSQYPPTSRPHICSPINSSSGSTFHPLDRTPPSVRSSNSVTITSKSAHHLSSANIIEPLFPVSTPSFHRTVVSPSTTVKNIPSKAACGSAKNGKNRKSRGGQLLSAGYGITSNSDSDKQEEEEFDDTGPNGTQSPFVDTRIRNLVFAAIIFNEFCFELAGICYAQCFGR